MTKNTKLFLRVLPTTLLAGLASIAGAQTTTPGVPTTAVGGLSTGTAYMILVALALIVVAAIIAFKVKDDKRRT